MLAKLPPELWLLILGLVTGASISPHEFCDHLNFPAVLYHLRSPRLHALNSPWLRDLQLVCRTFKTLLEPSPYFSMGRNTSQSNITPYVKAIYIRGNQDTGAQLQRLVAYPLKSRQIVMLELCWISCTNLDGVMPFDILCDNAQSLPNVRGLMLGLDNMKARTPPNFWERLHDSFPLIVCLAIRGPPPRCPQPLSLTFEKLEILDITSIHPHLTLHLPFLIHAAFGRFYGWDVVRPGGFCDHLESLILSDTQIPFAGPIMWSMLPQLRLLGISGRQIYTLQPLPPGHPLAHLYIYNLLPEVGGEPWLSQTIKLYPSISRLSLDLDEQSNVMIPWITRELRRGDLVPLGFDVNHAASKTSMYRVVVIDRLPARSQTPSSLLKGSQAGWKSFTRRLHL